ncbi:CIC11C00000004873 [Sungouiella intermedia]|uniref:CIC11C00000004873 n=1 Tax=Sungouiella intermedia TaxID=45354 RepID=A0A1L0DCF6_9ASCO|nr:CIC11C00000004873 [[Candida] intermedia]
MDCLNVLIYTFLVIVCQATTPLTGPAYSTIAPTESVVYTPPPLPTLTTSPYVLQSRPTSEFYPTDFSLLNLFESRSDVSHDNLVLMYALWTDYTRLAPSFYSKWSTELNLIYLAMGYVSYDVYSTYMAYISRVQHGSTSDAYIIGTVIRSGDDYDTTIATTSTTDSMDEVNTSMDTEPRLTNSFGVSTVTSDTSMDTEPRLTNSFGISTVTSDTTTPYVPDGYQLFIARSDISSQYSVFYQVPRYTSLRMPWSDYASLYLSFYSRYLSEFNFFELSLGFVSPDVMAEQRSQLSLYAEDYMDGYSSDDYGYIETYITESNDSIGYSGVSPSPSDAESSGAFASSTSGSNQSGASSSSSTSSFSSLDSSVDSSLSASSSSLSGISFGPASGSSTESSSGEGSGALSGSSGLSTAVGVSSGSSASSATTSSTSSSAIADTTKPYLILGAVIGSLPFLII